MALPELQQATSLLHRASHTLLVVPEKTSYDAFASLTAFYLALLQKRDAEHLEATARKMADGGRAHPADSGHDAIVRASATRHRRTRLLGIVERTSLFGAGRYCELRPEP